MATESQTQPELRYASLGDRFLGLIIDNIFLAILIIPIVILPETLRVIYFLLFAIFALFYVFILEGIWTNQTVGKYLLNMRVTKENGSEAGIVDSLIRNLIGAIGQAFGWIGLIVGAVAIWQTEKNQRVGDNVAGTVVVKNA